LISKLVKDQITQYVASKGGVLCSDSGTRLDYMFPTFPSAKDAEAYIRKMFHVTVEREFEHVSVITK
jgi:hypothetical protein